MFNSCVHAGDCFCLVQKLLFVLDKVDLILSVCVSNLSEFSFFLPFLSFHVGVTCRFQCIFSIIQPIINIKRWWTQDRSSQSTILMPLVTPLNIFFSQFCTHSLIYNLICMLCKVIFEPTSHPSGYLLGVHKHGCQSEVGVGNFHTQTGVTATVAAWIAAERDRRSQVALTSYPFWINTYTFMTRGCWTLVVSMEVCGLIEEF